MATGPRGGEAEESGAPQAGERSLPDKGPGKRLLPGPFVRHSHIVADVRLTVWPAGGGGSLPGNFKMVRVRQRRWQPPS